MKKYLAYASIILTVLFARLVPFHWIVGSIGSSFSWSTMLAPVVSKYAGLGWLSLFLIPIKGISCSTLCMFVVHRLPLLGASCAYKYRHFVVWIIIPLICMGLFVVHPIGMQAWPYAIYWCIPMTLWFLEDNIWFRALGASFVAHALGSIIWLYATDIPAPFWQGLIPVVIVERLCIASCMVAFDLVFSVYQKFVHRAAQRLLVAGWL